MISSLEKCSWSCPKGLGRVLNSGSVILPLYLFFLYLISYGSHFFLLGLKHGTTHMSYKSIRAMSYLQNFSSLSWPQIIQGLYSSVITSSTQAEIHILPPVTFHQNQVLMLLLFFFFFSSNRESPPIYILKVSLCSNFKKAYNRKQKHFLR